MGAGEQGALESPTPLQAGRMRVRQEGLIAVLLLYILTSARGQHQRQVSELNSSLPEPIMDRFFCPCSYVIQCTQPVPQLKPSFIKSCLLVVAATVQRLSHIKNRKKD